MASTKRNEPAEAMTAAFTGYDNMVALGKGNFAAVMQANAAALAGAQRLNSVFAAYLQTAYEANLAVAQALAGTKSVQEAMTLQSGHLQASLESAMTKSSELSEVALEVANDVAEPLQARTKVALDKLMAPVAA